ncbi:hypothetical protein IAT40_005311 [Kwoniella sp. CBS 6097]
MARGTGASRPKQKRKREGSVSYPSSYSSSSRERQVTGRLKTSERLRVHSRIHSNTKRDRTNRPDSGERSSWEKARALVSECVICSEELEDILLSAEKAGKGGLGGGLALFTCDQPSCGALYCIGCAVKLVQQHVQESSRLESDSPPKCCVCTRPWNLKSLQDQAKAFDPTAYSELNLASDDEEDYRFSRPPVRRRVEEERNEALESASTEGRARRHLANRGGTSAGGARGGQGRRGNI